MLLDSSKNRVTPAHTCGERTMFLYNLLLYSSALILIFFLSLCITSGIVFLADLAEEHATCTKYCLEYMVQGLLVMHLLLIFFEDFPMAPLGLGIVSLLGYSMQISNDFPVLKPSALAFWVPLLCSVGQCYTWYRYFSVQSRWIYPIAHSSLIVFSLCILTPLSLLVSSSFEGYANQLPTSSYGADEVIDKDHNKYSRDKTGGMAVETADVKYTLKSLCSCLSWFSTRKTVLPTSTQSAPSSPVVSAEVCESVPSPVFVPSRSIFSSSTGTSGKGRRCFVGRTGTCEGVIPSSMLSELDITDDFLVASPMQRQESSEASGLNKLVRKQQLSTTQ